jgi:ubiquinone/menaquinone biosynthesis C-methylase UbiE
MKYFNEVFHALPRQGPGCEETTRRAWQILHPLLPRNAEILDIGCGSGASTLCLARLGNARMIGMDNDAKLLKQLSADARAANLGNRIKTIEASMFQLPFEDASFDVTWAEGCLYIIGFEQGLNEWRRLLRPGGFMAVTELCWIRDNPPHRLREYWAKGYPAITTVDTSLALAEKAGYSVIDHFILPEEAWTTCYYQPMQKRISEMRRKYPDTDEVEKLCRELEKEIQVYEEYGTYFGYVFFLLKKNDL